MVFINTDFSEELDREIEIVKAENSLPTKPAAVKMIVEEYFKVKEKKK